MEETLLDVENELSNNANNLKFEWKPVLGDCKEYGETTIKGKNASQAGDGGTFNKNHQKMESATPYMRQICLTIDGDDFPVTCVRTLCIMVSLKAIQLCNEFNKDKVEILTDEISQVFVHQISQFINRDVNCFNIINDVVVKEARCRNFSSKKKFGYMWNDYLLQNIKCLINTNYKFIGVVEAPKYGTRNSIVRKYPNMDLNIPGGKVSVHPKDWIEDNYLMCIIEGLREMTEETGMTILSEFKDETIIYDYLGSENQLEMRKRYKLDPLPLKVYRKNTDSKGDLIFIWLL